MRLDFLSLNLYICKRMSLTGHKQKHKHKHTHLVMSLLYFSLLLLLLFSFSLSLFQFQYQFQFQCVLIFDLSMSATRGFFYWSLTFLLPFYFIFLLCYLLLHPPGQQNYQIHLIFLCFLFRLLLLF
jgi:uncharacterized BrkB/YihY/UPF0761 family membrane protein